MQAGTGFWGWDIGGAHLKLAILAENGELMATRTWATPLWRGLECLDTAIAEVRNDYPADKAQHAFTLTGELTDCFADRRQGVLVLLKRWQTAIGQDGWVYASGGELTPGGLALPDPLMLASRNWCATASLCATLGVSGYLVDMGSTTTDIIPVQGGRVLARAEDDGGRLQTGELVYTGFLRTAVGTLSDRAPWQGRWQGLAQECFATTADVYRLLGELDEGVDLYPAADGAAKTPEASAARLARMLGRDAEEAPLQTWQALADYFARCQRRRLLDALMLCGSVTTRASGSVLVAAGIGNRQIQRLAAAWGLPCIDLGAVCRLPSEHWPRIAQVGPAYAVARLLRDQISRPTGVA